MIHIGHMVVVKQVKQEKKRNESLREKKLIKKGDTPNVKLLKDNNILCIIYIVILTYI